eukprot:GHVO01057596.1.p2 GENE.GHVO01057596.1~~GHVO01057596.1.p2  ORF type:complete len:100 (+),score=11.09 GHVO01057596.1:224-523(+)
MGKWSVQLLTTWESGAFNSSPHGKVERSTPHHMGKWSVQLLTTWESGAFNSSPHGYMHPHHMATCILATLADVDALLAMHYCQGLEASNPYSEAAPPKA